MSKYYVVGYDDIGRVVARSSIRYFSISKAARAAQKLFSSPRVASTKILKLSVRGNPETVATATVIPAPPVAVNPRRTRRKR
jgi:hypothetical protein